MQNVNKFESIFKKLNKTNEESEFTIAECSESDEENQSFSNISSCSIERSTIGKSIKQKVKKRKTKRFNPLQVKQTNRRKSVENYTHSTSYIDTEEVISTPETEIHWESSGEDLDKTYFKDSISNTASSIGARAERIETKESKKNILKRCRKDGFLFQLKHILEKAKMDQKFLKYDQKLGMRTGQRLQVLKLEYSFGVPIATTTTTDGNQLNIILDNDIDKFVKVGDTLEAFFDENIKPYRILSSELEINLQPRQLLYKT